MMMMVFLMAKCWGTLLTLFIDSITAYVRQVDRPVWSNESHDVTEYD